MTNKDELIKKAVDNKSTAFRSREPSKGWIFVNR